MLLIKIYNADPIPTMELDAHQVLMKLEIHMQCCRETDMLSP